MADASRTQLQASTRDRRATAPADPPATGPRGPRAAPGVPA